MSEQLNDVLRMRWLAVNLRKYRGVANELSQVRSRMAELRQSRRADDLRASTDSPAIEYQSGLKLLPGLETLCANYVAKHRELALLLATHLPALARDCGLIREIIDANEFPHDRPSFDWKEYERQLTEIELRAAGPAVAAKKGLFNSGHDRSKGDWLTPGAPLLIIARVYGKDPRTTKNALKQTGLIQTTPELWTCDMSSGPFKNPMKRTNLVAAAMAYKKRPASEKKSRSAAKRDKEKQRRA